jgi:hypothetical protein
MKKAISPIAMSPSGTPNPIPIFAPLDKSHGVGDEVWEFVNVVEVVVSVAEELVGLDVGCVGVLDGCE